MGRFISFSISSESDGSADDDVWETTTWSAGSELLLRLAVGDWVRISSVRSRLAGGEGDREGNRFVTSGMVVEVRWLAVEM